jgi:GH25 family lysozyme M1 (1,4-beta-N-acetylmuramidase)
MSVLGLDVSHWDKGIYFPTIDWSKAKEKFKYVFIKSSEGDYYRDDMFKTQWQAARGHVLRAPYHFFRMRSNAIKQAKLMIEMVNGDWGELPPVIDLEENYTSLTAVGSFLYEIEKECKTIPIIYTGVGFWTTSGGQTSAGNFYKRYPLWLASYWYAGSSYFENWYNSMMIHSETIKYPTPPKPWEKVTFWQWTDMGKPKDVLGYPEGKRQVDFNYFNGTEEELKKLGSSTFVSQIPPVSFPVSAIYKVIAFPSLRIREIPDITGKVMGTMFWNTTFKVKKIFDAGEYAWMELETGGYSALRKLSVPTATYAELVK